MAAASIYHSMEKKTEVKNKKRIGEILNEVGMNEIRLLKINARIVMNIRRANFEIDIDTNIHRAKFYNRKIVNLVLDKHAVGSRLKLFLDSNTIKSVRQ